MKYAIRYLSYSGNTKKIADAISKVVKVPADDISIKVDKNIDILFLGCAVYAFNIDQEIIDFIKNLKNVKKVAIFSTSAICSKIAYKKIIKLLNENNIAYFENYFHCYGQYKKTRLGRPNENDILEAETFAKEIMKEGFN